MNAAFPASLTSCSLWKTTTLPPLSPVANSSPDELNSTVEIMSAAAQGSRARRWWGGGLEEMSARGHGQNKKLEKTEKKKKKSCQGASQTKGGRRGTWDKTWPENFKAHLRNRKWSLSRWTRVGFSLWHRCPSSVQIWVRRNDWMTHCVIPSNSVSSDWSQPVWVT